MMRADMTTSSSKSSEAVPHWLSVRRSPLLLVATWGGAGLAPMAPGTAGTFAALPFVAMVLWSLPATGALMIALVLLVVGSIASQRAGQEWGKPDHGAIVVDEVLGMLLTVALPWYLLSPTVSDLAFFSLGFATFRAFDIAKPWPASWCDKHLKNGLGVMLDDVAAGLWAALVMVGGLQLDFLS